MSSARNMKLSFGKPIYYELYSLMLLGEWSRIQTLTIDVLKNTNRMDQAKILMQADILAVACPNMQLLESPDLISEEYFRLKYRRGDKDK
jgi:hypothetical protein